MKLFRFRRKEPTNEASQAVDLTTIEDRIVGHFMTAPLIGPFDLETVEKELGNDLKGLSKLDEIDRNILLSRAFRKVLDLVRVSFWRGDTFKEKSQELILKMFSQITDDKLKCELLLDTFGESSSYDRYFVQLAVKSAPYINDSLQRGSLLQAVASRTNNAEDLKLCVDALCLLNREDSEFFSVLARFSIDKLRVTRGKRFGEIAITCIANLSDQTEQAELYRTLFRTSYDCFRTKFWYPQGAGLRALVLGSIVSPELKLQVLADGVLEITRLGSLSDEDAKKALQDEAMNYLRQACEMVSNANPSFNAQFLLIQEVVPSLLSSVTSEESYEQIYPFLEYIFLSIEACDKGRTQSGTPSFLESAFSDAINTINTLISEGLGSYRYRSYALASIADKLKLNVLMASQLISFLPSVDDSFASLIAWVSLDLLSGVDSDSRQQLVGKLFADCLNRGLYRQAVRSARFYENVVWVRNKLLDKMAQIINQPKPARAVQEVHDFLDALLASSNLPRDTLSDVTILGLKFLLRNKAYNQIAQLAEKDLRSRAVGTRIVVPEVLDFFLAGGEIDLASAFLLSFGKRSGSNGLSLEEKEIFAQELMRAYLMRERLPWRYLWQALRVERKERYIRRREADKLGLDRIAESLSLELVRLSRDLEDLKRLDSDQEKRVKLFSLLTDFERLQDLLIFNTKTSTDEEDDVKRILEEWFKNFLEVRKKILDVADQLNFKLPILLELTNIQLSTYSAAVRDRDYSIVASVLQRELLGSLDDFENLKEFETDHLSEFWKKVVFLQILDCCYFGLRSRDFHYASLASRLTNLRKKLGFEFQDLEVIWDPSDADRLAETALSFEKIRHLEESAFYARLYHQVIQFLLEDRNRPFIGELCNWFEKQEFRLILDGLPETDDLSWPELRERYLAIKRQIS